MRGDGAKAKDITPIPQAPDSPPSGIPQNIPYPTLAGTGGQFASNPWPNQVSGLPSPSSPGTGLGARTRTLSGNANDTLNALSASAAAVASSTSNPFNRSSSSTSTSSNQPTSAGGRSGAEKFFSSLGRKNSKRSAPSGLTMSSGSGTISGPRAPRSAGASGNISSPIQSSSGGNSSPSAQRRSFDLLSSSSSGQESPSGLGISPSPPSPFAKQESPASAGLGSGRETSFTSSRSPLGPRAPGSQPLSNSPGLMAASQDSYLLDRKNSATSSQGYESGGSLSVTDSGGGGGSTSRRGSSSTPTDYSSEKRSSPSPIRSREDSNPGFSPATSPSLNNNNNNPTNVKSSFSYGSVRKLGGVGSSSASKNDAFEESLTKLNDILPDADPSVLSEYLRKANGDDLVAIGDYLQDQSTGKLLSPGKGRSASRSPIRR